MQDILADLARWKKENRSIATATVIQTWGSSPRGVGSKMALTLDGEVTGSVSGGCVENAVIEAGIQSLKTGRPQLLHFGVTDETAWEVGLACGGSIDVFVNPLENNFFEDLLSALENNKSLAIATVIRGSDVFLGRKLVIHKYSQSTGWLGNNWNGLIDKLASKVILRGDPQRVALDDEVELFLESILPPPTLIMVGGVHIAIALSSLAKTLGYRTVVIDPRKVWGNMKRFPHVDQLIQTWPDDAFQKIEVTRSTAIATLTHDPKMDDPTLKFALSSLAFYVGALGSKTTQAKRRERLLYEGLTESRLDRLHGPIGLDINARTPEEIALAIMAEVVGAYRKQEQEPIEVDAE
ncbi:MAG: XdhC family protein [Anaerolineales bacterium]|jgi:xanthine dehydrogenase accessory factor